MMNKKIITWAFAGAIILAGVGGASVITARNLDKFREAERESSTAISELLTSTQPAPSVGTTAPTTTKQASAPQTTKAESGSKTTAPTEVQTTKITWAYDAGLSKQVGKLLENKPVFKGSSYDVALKKEFHPENMINLYDGTISNSNDRMSFVGQINEGESVAQAIVSIWTDVRPPKTNENFGIAVYKYSTGEYYAIIFY